MSKKIKPTYKKEFEKYRIFYGSNSNTSSKSTGKKTNMICTNPNCGYSSRVFICSMGEPSHNASYTCPKHQVKLINVGNACEIPKKGTKARKELILKYSK